MALAVPSGFSIGMVMRSLSSPCPDLDCLVLATAMGTPGAARAIAPVGVCSSSACIIGQEGGQSHCCNSTRGMALEFAGRPSTPTAGGHPVGRFGKLTRPWGIPNHV